MLLVILARQGNFRDGDSVTISRRQLLGFEEVATRLTLDPMGIVRQPDGKDLVFDEVSQNAFNSGLITGYR